METSTKNDIRVPPQNLMFHHKITELADDLEQTISSTVQERIQSWREGIVPSVVLEKNSFQPNNISKTCNKKNPGNGKLTSKIFVARESLLTELLKMNHIRSIYNAFGGILFILFLQQLLEELVNTGSIDLKISYLCWAFGETSATISTCLLMNVSTMFVVYGLFHHWANNRHNAPHIYDLLGVVVYIIYLVLFVHLPLQSLIKNNLPPASSIAVLCEQTRLLMKTWAFVRSNIPRAMNYKKDDNKQYVQSCPKFSQHLYFVFAPTLIYRDQYPRTVSCCWMKVMTEFAQVFGCIIYIHFLLTRFCFSFENFGKETFSNTKLLMMAFTCCFPASMILLCGFFLILHSWQNAFAEMLRFADRMFYQDWWNSTSFPRFYRTWNCIIYDWLYEYVYMELTNLQLQRKKIFFGTNCLPMFAVFFISSIVHEYILSFAFKFFYPVLLFMFGGIGCLLMFFRTKASVFNAFIWMSLILGTGILMCLYGVEWNARINCLRVMEGFEDYLIPRSWFCIIQSRHL